MDILINIFRKTKQAFPCEQEFIPLVKSQKLRPCTQPLDFTPILLPARRRRVHLPFIYFFTFAAERLGPRVLGVLSQE